MLKLTWMPSLAVNKQYTQSMWLNVLIEFLYFYKSKLNPSIWRTYQVPATHSIYSLYTFLYMYDQQLKVFSLYNNIW